MEEQILRTYIKELKAKMESKLAELKEISDREKLTLDDGNQALYCVHWTWDSKEYNRLREFLVENGYD